MPPLVIDNMAACYDYGYCLAKPPGTLTVMRHVWRFNGELRAYNAHGGHTPLEEDAFMLFNIHTCQ